jgi:thiamine biosynthesis lipoprotein
MDTVVAITVHNTESESAISAIDAAFARLYEIEKLFSHTDPSSELNYVNFNAYASPVPVSEEMGGLIEEGLRLSELTGGAFDISLGMLITVGSVHEQILPNLGYEHIIYDPDKRTVEFTSRIVALNFGAIAKGYALAEMQEILFRQGVSSAIINIGGEIGVVGQAPRNDGIWKVGIQDPHNPGEVAHVAEILNRSDSGYDLVTLATSGIYERGEHIYDRRTGKPAESDYASVTVLTARGTAADALSTAIFVGGKDFSASISEGVEEGYCVVYIDKEGTVTVNHFNSRAYCYCSGVSVGTHTD